MGTVQLKGQKPFASGQSRDVYIHPDDPGLLVKVINENGHQRTYRRWYRHSGPLAVSEREIREQDRLKRRYGRLPSFMQPIVGTVDTDLGPGLVVVAARNHDGTYAEPLHRSLRDTTVDARTVEAVRSFMRAVEATPAVLRDVHWGNLVLVHDADGSRRLALVDGFGDRGMFGLRSLLHAINQRRNVAHLKKLRRQTARFLPTS